MVLPAYGCHHILVVQTMVNLAIDSVDSFLHIEDAIALLNVGHRIKTFGVEFSENQGRLWVSRQFNLY